MAAEVRDDAFHEIQLNGKQLVFVFMVATVASVVIFLSGVFVGRGVRTDRTAAEEASAAMVESPSADAVPPKSQPPNAAASGGDPTAAAPPPTVDDQGYVNRLEKRNAALEDLKPAPLPTVKAASEPPKGDRKSVNPSSAERPAGLETKATTSSPDEKVRAEAKTAAAPRSGTAQAAVAEPAASPQAPTGQGYVVQVAALNVRSEADAIVKRLVSKGYAAYVQPPATGTPSVFRVRVGPFGSRREADASASKLQKEEQFKPWVTR